MRSLLRTLSVVSFVGFLLAAALGCWSRATKVDSLPATKSAGGRGFPIEWQDVQGEFFDGGAR